MKNKFLQEAKMLEQELIKWRRKFHKTPELGLKLPETVSYIKDELDKMGVEYKVYEDVSLIIAVIGKGKRCFLLRSDMDALPMREESGVEYSSENDCMHACGHDLHAATLLGAAKILKKYESNLKGTVKLLFQSGEEIFKGAKEAIKRGILEDPDVGAAFAMHVAPQVPANIIAYGKYPMASVYGFRITLLGKGTHGSQPELGIDPINTGVHIHLALQELMSREVSASSEAALTIGRFEAGSVSNVIPDKAVLEGTLRTFENNIMKRLIRRIEEVVKYTAMAYRTSYELEVLCDIPAVKCDNELNEKIAGYIREMDDDILLHPLFHSMGSEDFAFFSEKVSSSYFCIGAAVENEGEQYPQHNPRVKFNEGCMSLAAGIYAYTAVRWLEDKI